MKNVLLDDLAINVNFDGRRGRFGYSSFQNNVVNSNFSYIPSNDFIGNFPSEWQTRAFYKNLPDSFISVYYSRFNFNDRKELLSKVDYCTRAFAVCHEFSGKDHNGKRVMGLAPNACSTIIFNINQYHLWTIPDYLSLEEACTIPQTYCLVYNSLLMTKSKITKDSIVILNTRLFDLQLAAFNILSSFGCKIFILHENKTEIEKMLNKNFKNSEMILTIDNKDNFKIFKSADYIFNYRECLKLHSFCYNLKRNATIIDIDGQGRSIFKFSLMFKFILTKLT